MRTLRVKLKQNQSQYLKSTEIIVRDCNNEFSKIRRYHVLILSPPLLNYHYTECPYYQFVFVQ